MFVRCFLILLAMSIVGISQNLPKIEPGVSHDLAIWRAARYSNVRYKLDLTLEKMSLVLKGTIEIRVTVGARTLLSASPQSGENLSEGPRTPSSASPLRSEIDPIILDWRKIAGHEKDSTVSNVSINGVGLSPAAIADKSVRAPFEEENDHLIFRDGVKTGENVIKLDFTSPILTSGSAITRYIDKEDGKEYLYSLFVPSDASTAFPVFDQPDLKARFTLQAVTPDTLGPDTWQIVSNTAPINIHQTEQYVEVGKTATSVTLEKSWVKIWTFPETKPISTYVFAFAAGPWVRVSVPPAVAGGSRAASTSTSQPPRPSVTPSPSVVQNPPATEGGTDTEARADTPRDDVPTSVYVRASQAARFQKEAPEVFGLTREGLKYLADYFDYPFPFPKYDIVLIPEFPFGGMEHAGATFLREDRIIFPQEPTKNDYITRANVIFHEEAHQWFGDTVTMRWFDDLWLKEGFAEFMAYKTMEKVMPEYNAWKIFYERNKQAAYATDSTKGTTPIYQPIENLSAAKSAYGNIVYRKAPSFLRQAEFYLGQGKFQTGVRAFLEKHEFANAGWEDLVSDFTRAKCDLPEHSASVSPSQLLCSKEVLAWADGWVKQRGIPIIKWKNDEVIQTDAVSQGSLWTEKFQLYQFTKNSDPRYKDSVGVDQSFVMEPRVSTAKKTPDATFLFPNYGDYGYGIFLLDDKSRDYVLRNIQNEKDDFLRTMMWGSLWDSVREAEMDPREYVELVIKNIGVETDESTIQTLLGRVSTALNYYIPTDAERVSSPRVSTGSTGASANNELRTRLENMLLDRMRHAATQGQRITYYRSFLNNASSENARRILKEILNSGLIINGRSSSQSPPRPSPPRVLGAGRVANSMQRSGVINIPQTKNTLTTKDKFDIVTRLAILGDPDAPALLEQLERTETSADAKRYAYAAHAGFATAENKAKYWNDLVNNKQISESWIESALGPFNSVRQSELTLPYLDRALAQLPELKRTRKIFFVNNWLAAWIGGQRSEAALAIVNKFLAGHPQLDNDLRLKVLENVDLIERAVNIRRKFGNAP